MKLYVILQKNNLGEWKPARDKHAGTYEQTKAFVDINTAKRSMSGLKAFWKGEYKIVCYVEDSINEQNN